MSPLIPPEWESIEAPTMRVTPPGPRSREVLDRIERNAYPGLSAGLTPLALDSKRAWTVTDLDGNLTRRQNAVKAGLPANFFVLNPDVSSANVTDSGAFIGPFTCGSLPAKSITMRSPVLRIARRIQNGASAPSVVSGMPSPHWRALPGWPGGST